MSQFNNKPHFPYTYGDKVKDDETRISVKIVEQLSKKRTQNYLKSIVVAIIMLGSQAAPVNAIPPEYGEFAAEALKNVDQQIPNVPADAIKATTPKSDIPPVNNLHDPNRQVPNIRENKLAVQLPGPPTTQVGRYINTTAIAASVVVICLNAVWGTPFMAAGCAAMLIAAGNRLFGN